MQNINLFVLFFIYLLFLVPVVSIAFSMFRHALQYFMKLV